MKTLFAEQKIQFSGQLSMYLWLCGSITNGSHKLEIRIACHKDSFNMGKGDPVIVTGKVNKKGKKI